MSRAKTMGRNANGSGSIRKITTTRNGKEYTYWQARYTVGYDPGTGKQIQRSITGKSQKVVADKLKKVLYELDNGSYCAPTKQILGEWLDEWLENYTSNIKPRTREIYETGVRVHIKPGIGAVHLDKLDTQTVQLFCNSLVSEKNLSPKYIHNLHGILHKALSQAVTLGRIKTNAADSCILPRKEKREITPLDENEIAAFLKQIKDDILENLLKVALFTGEREGEVMALSWDAVDFTNGTITINKQIQRFREEQGVYRIVSTKNGKSRVITAAPYVMDILRAQKEQQEQQKACAGKAWNNPHNLVFTDPLGNHLTNSIVYRHFKRAARSIGRPDARFHDLRHSYAVAAIKSGDDIKTVQENLGHATASFTLDVYGHVTEQMKQASANRMETFIQNVIPQG